MSRRSIPLKHVALRQGRRRRRWWWAFSVLLLLIAGGLIFLAEDRRWLINQVSVTGTTTLGRDLLAQRVVAELAGDYWWLVPRRNIFLYPKAAITARLAEEFPPISRLRLSLIGLNHLVVEVAERAARFRWCVGPRQSATSSPTGCWLVDREGKAFATDAFSDQQNFWLIVDTASSTGLGQTVGSAEQMSQLETLFTTLPTALARTVGATTSLERITILSDRNYELLLKTRQASTIALWKIMTTAEQSVDTISKTIATIWSAPGLGNRPQALAKLEYIDLRFGRRVFYKFK